jgi:ribonuclease P protein component
MLKKINRLTKDKDFELVFKKGKSAYDQLVGIKHISNTQEINRYGIIVSSKVSKKAVIRNKIKRLIREIIKNQEIYLKKGYDIVIITFPGIINNKKTEISESIIKGLTKLKLYL